MVTQRVARMMPEWSPVRSEYRSLQGPAAEENTKNVRRSGAVVSGMVSPLTVTD